MTAEPMMTEPGADGGDPTGGRADLAESREDLFDDDTTPTVPAVAWLLGNQRAVVVTASCASAQEADRIGRALVESRLAAAAGHRPSTTAYLRDGEVLCAAEATLEVKTIACNVKAVGLAIEAAHSYATGSIWVTAAYVGGAVRSWLLSELNVPDGETAAGCAGVDSEANAQVQLNAEEAMELAVAETRAVRSERRAGSE